MFDLSRWRRYCIVVMRMRGAIWLSVIFLVLTVSSAECARFTDTFSTSPAATGHKPFLWDQFNAYSGTTWRASGGVIEYQATDQIGSLAGVHFASAGVEITDDTSWSIEVGFRHVSGEVPRDYEFIVYARWYSRVVGQMRILGLAYDAAKREISIYNAYWMKSHISADLTERFHPVRMTVAQGQVRVFVDGKLVAGPYHIRPRAYRADREFLFGPLTQTKEHSLHCQWDYFAFTDEGAFAPGEGKWRPSRDQEPVAEGLKMVVVANVFDQPPYPGIKVLSKQKGSDRWEQAIPEHIRLYRQVISKTPKRRKVPFYNYPDEEGTSIQNVYENSYALKYDEKRCIGIAMLTRGTGDTATGFMDYKMWYRVSTDGGITYGELKPIVQHGERYSPMHPIEYVYVGKNSFCYATIPGIMLKMSNGQIFFPCYYAPLTANGDYYNPLNAYTFSWVCGIIGTWNQAGDDLIWDVSQPVKIDVDQSSRGADECAIIELAGKPGHIFMVIRGSNQPNPTGNIPAYKWKTLSTDYGKTWSKCEPFTFDDGTPFLSPSSCCSFIRSSKTGKCYWVGNISRVLPRGNWPRYPLVIGELDEETLSLRRKTVTIIDDRQPDDPPNLQLSNYGLIEDQKTQEIIVHLNRWMPEELRHSHPGAGAYTYVIEVD